MSLLYIQNQAAHILNGICITDIVEQLSYHSDVFIPSCPCGRASYFFWLSLDGRCHWQLCVLLSLPLYSFDFKGCGVFSYLLISIYPQHQYHTHPVCCTPTPLPSSLPQPHLSCCHHVLNYSADWVSPVFDFPSESCGHSQNPSPKQSLQHLVWHSCCLPMTSAFAEYLQSCQR